MNIGDKVIITEESLFNGRIGYIEAIYPAGMFCKYELALVKYENNNFHKGQFKTIDLRVLN